MHYKEIPSTAVEVQKGLWWDYTPFTYNGTTIHAGRLYAAEGYCFYDLNRPENYNTDGTLLSSSELIYEVYCTCLESSAEGVNSYIVSVPYQEGYTVV